MLRYRTFGERGRRSTVKIRLGQLAQGHHLGTDLGLGRCQIGRNRKTPRNMLVTV